jgi:hypothetical protein
MAPFLLGLMSDIARRQKVIHINYAGAQHIVGTEHQMFAWITSSVRLGLPQSGYEHECRGGYIRADKSLDAVVLTDCASLTKEIIAHWGIFAR